MIAEIIHEADLDDDRYDTPEAPGHDTVLRGLSMNGDDEHTMSITRPLVDALTSTTAEKVSSATNPPEAPSPRTGR